MRRRPQPLLRPFWPHPPPFSHSVSSKHAPIAKPTSSISFPGPPSPYKWEPHAPLISLTPFPESLLPSPVLFFAIRVFLSLAECHFVAICVTISGSPPPSSSHPASPRDVLPHALTHLTRASSVPPRRHRLNCPAAKLLATGDLFTPSRHRGKHHLPRFPLFHLRTSPATIALPNASNHWSLFVGRHITAMWCHINATSAPLPACALVCRACVANTVL